MTELYNLAITDILKQIWSDFVDGRRKYGKIIWTNDNIYKYMIRNKETIKELAKELCQGETWDEDLIIEYLDEVLDIFLNIDDEDDLEDEKQVLDLINIRKSQLNAWIEIISKEFV